MKLMFIYNSETFRAFTNYVKTTPPVFYKLNNKAWMRVYLFIAWFMEYFKPTFETYCSEKKNPFRILLFIDNVPIHPKSLMEMYKEITVIFVSANTTFIL